MSGYIYIIKNTKNKKVYIGQTTKTINERWTEHKYHAEVQDRNQLIYSTMRKHGVENFYIEELYEASKDESLDDLEILFIKQYNSMTPNGYNMVKGGSKFKDDNPMYHDEIRKKVSERFVGDLNPAKRPEVKEKIRQKALGKKASDETKKKMSENNGRYWKGKKHSEETRRKISQNHGCRGKFGGMNPASKKVERIDKNTLIVLEVYDSIVDAIKWVHENVNENGSASNISSACHGHQKTAFGYIWKLVEEV